MARKYADIPVCCISALCKYGIIIRDMIVSEAEERDGIETPPTIFLPGQGSV